MIRIESHVKEELLQLQHKKILEESLPQIGMGLSEYSFATLFLFRKKHEYMLRYFPYKTSSLLFIQGKTYDGKDYLMPTHDLRLFDPDLLASIAKKNMLFPIPEPWGTHFDRARFSITSVEDDSDYLFLSSQFTTYPGRNLSGRRNLVKQFTEKNIALMHNFEGIRKRDALQLLDQWKQMSGKDDQNSDYEPCKEAIELLDELNLKGYIWYVAQKPVGFILYELFPLYNDLENKMCCIHFAKADTSYKGIYQYIYQEHAKALSKEVILCNWEQDLGDEGLRKSKRAYMPYTLLKKIRIVAK